MGRWKTAVALGLLAGGLSGAWAEVTVSDPGFVSGETCRYVETFGSVTRAFETSLVRTGEGASARWEYRTKGADSEGVYRLDPATLVSLSSESLTRTPDATVRRTADYQGLKPNPGPDGLAVTDQGSLAVMLRGFPWGRLTGAKVVYLGNPAFGGSGITVEFAVTGREKVTAAGRSWDCWHATTGLSGALGLVMPKTEWWFAADGNHVLVRTSGPSGGPGSPTRTLVLDSVRAP